jgi:hypothetical protein
MAPGRFPLLICHYYWPQLEPLERNRSNDKSLQIKFYEPAGPARSHRVARQQFLVDGASAAGNVIFRRYQPQSVTSQQPPDLPPPCPLAAVLSPPHESEFSSSPPPHPPSPHLRPLLQRLVSMLVLALSHYNRHRHLLRSHPLHHHYHHCHYYLYYLLPHHCLHQQSVRQMRCWWPRSY